MSTTSSKVSLVAYFIDSLTNFVFRVKLKQKSRS